VHVGSSDGPSPFGPSPVHWVNGLRPNVAGHSLGGGTQESVASTNWAGWIASGTTFTGIGADWTVPTVAPAQPAEDSSEWIGIDGVSDTDLIQTGTSQDTVGGTTSYFAWYELLPAPSVLIAGTLAPGDSMEAAIVETSPGSGTWTITIEDLTQKWTYTNSFSYSIPALSAEWIEEAPIVDGSQSTLADFGSTSFSSLGISGTDLAAGGLTAVDLVNSSLAIIAYPTAIDNSSFSVLYGTPQPEVTSISPTSGPTAGGTTVTIEGNYFYGATAAAFGGVDANGQVNADGSITVVAPPGSPGVVNVTVTTPGGTSAPVPGDEYTYLPPPQHGYWLVGSDGGIFSFGSAQFYGSTGALRLQRPVVGIVPTADRGGYWLDASDGGSFAFGDAGFYGSIPGLGLHPAGSGLPNSLDAPIVGMVPSADGGGYFMVASDGGVFAFGDARFAGSCPGIGGCAGPAVAVMPDATGNGYWVVTQNGLVYTFGDALYFGAPGPQSVPVTSAVRSPDGGGYWILFANGAIASYGDAGMFGQPLGEFGGLNPATAIFCTSDGYGYWVASANGSVANYGDAPYDGSMAGTRLNGSIIAATGW
jgi:hypothetical protein